MTNQFASFFAASRLCVKTRICHAKALRRKVQTQLRINERVSYFQPMSHGAIHLSPIGPSVAVGCRTMNSQAAAVAFLGFG